MDNGLYIQNRKVSWDESIDLLWKNDIECRFSNNSQPIPCWSLFKLIAGDYGFSGRDYFLKSESQKWVVIGTQFWHLFRITLCIKTNPSLILDLSFNLIIGVAMKLGMFLNVGLNMVIASKKNLYVTKFPNARMLKMKPTVMSFFQFQPLGHAPNPILPTI